MVTVLPFLGQFYRNLRTTFGERSHRDHVRGDVNTAEQGRTPEVHPKVPTLQNVPQTQTCNVYGLRDDVSTTFPANHGTAKRTFP